MQSVPELIGGVDPAGSSLAAGLLPHQAGGVDDGAVNVGIR